MELFLWYLLPPHNIVAFFHTCSLVGGCGPADGTFLPLIFLSAVRKRLVCRLRCTTMSACALTLVTHFVHDVVGAVVARIDEIGADV